MIDRAKLFEGLRQGPFPGKLTASQVQGISAVLDDWDKRELSFLPYLAYALAIDFHETAATMQPVIETFNPAKDKQLPTIDQAVRRLESSWKRGKMPWVKKPYWRKDANGLSWLGRGLPQCTFQRNYALCETKTGVPFTQNPDLMLDLEHAAPILLPSLLEGWWTGKKLSDYLTTEKLDWFNARRCVNATESAAKVAGYAKLIHSDLIAAST